MPHPHFYVHLMSHFGAQDTEEFDSCFQEILLYVEDPANWSQTKAELRGRGVSNSVQEYGRGLALGHECVILSLSA